MDELIEFYCAETGHSPRIVAPFLAADVEPPMREVTDRVGFTFRQLAIIGKAADDA